MKILSKVSLSIYLTATLSSALHETAITKDWMETYKTLLQQEQVVPKPEGTLYLDSKIATTVENLKPNVPKIKANTKKPIYKRINGFKNPFLKTPIFTNFMRKDSLLKYPSLATSSDDLGGLESAPAIINGCIDKLSPFYCNSYKSLCRGNKYVKKNCAKTCDADVCQFILVDGLQGLELDFEPSSVLITDVEDNKDQTLEPESKLEPKQEKITDISTDEDFKTFMTDWYQKLQTSPNAKASELGSDLKATFNVASVLSDEEGNNIEYPQHLILEPVIDEILVNDSNKELELEQLTINEQINANDAIDSAFPVSDLQDLKFKGLFFE